MKKVVLSLAIVAAMFVSCKEAAAEADTTMDSVATEMEDATNEVIDETADAIDTAAVKVDETVEEVKEEVAVAEAPVEEIVPEKPKRGRKPKKKEDEE